MNNVYLYITAFLIEINFLISLNLSSIIFTRCAIILAKTIFNLDTSLNIRPKLVVCISLDIYLYLYLYPFKYTACFNILYSDLNL